MAEHDNMMGNIVTIGLVGIGAYFLYEWLIAPNLPQVSAAGTTPGTTGTMSQTAGTTSVSTAPSTTSPAIQSQSTPQQIQAKMLASGDDPTQNHTVWEWNFYYQQVSGIPGPDPTVILPQSPSPTTQLIPFGTWWTAMQKAGFSGLGAFQRFAAPFIRQPPTNMTFVASHPLPYAPGFNLFHGLGRMGAMTQATGLEKAIWAGGSLNRAWNRGW